jgi:hypothetical protein
VPEVEVRCIAAIMGGRLLSKASGTSRPRGDQASTLGDSLFAQTRRCRYGEMQRGFEAKLRTAVPRQKFFWKFVVACSL